MSRLAKRKRAEQEAGEGEGEEHDEKEEKKYRGRGKEVRMVMETLAATSQRWMLEIGATIASITRMAKAQRRLKDLGA